MSGSSNASPTAACGTINASSSRLMCPPPTTWVSIAGLTCSAPIYALISMVGLSPTLSIGRWATDSEAETEPRGPVMYDLILKGGTVIDASQNLNGGLDLAVQGGKIAHLAPAIPREEARRVID